MSSDRSQSSGVRNLAAMFENPDPSSSARGRSPNRSSSANNSSSSPRRSAVRASFIPVESAGRKASENDTTNQDTNASTAEKRRPSFSFDETTDAKAMADLRKTITQELEKRRNSAAIETVPEVAVVTPAVERRHMEFALRGRPSAGGNPAGTANTKDVDAEASKDGDGSCVGQVATKEDDGSSINQSTLKGDDVNSITQVTSPGEDQAAGDRAVSPTSHGPSQKPDIKDEPRDELRADESTQAEHSTDEHNDTKEVKIKVESPESERDLGFTEKPGTASHDAQSQTSQASKGATEKSPTTLKARPSTKGVPNPNDTKASGERRRLTSRSYSTQSAGNSPRPSLGSKPRSTSTKDLSKSKGENADAATTNKASRQSIASATSSSTTRTKPRPKSPTRPVKLPASATAPTAASAAKTAASAGAASSRTPNGGSANNAIGRQASTRSKARPTPPTRTSSIKATNGSARSAASAPKPSAEAHGPAAGQKSAGQGFLARMMRPTASSASKVHDKVVPVLKSSTSHGHKEYAGKHVEKVHGNSKGNDKVETEQTGDGSI